jgi:ribosomal protein L3 glutamine methyltransferase
MTLIALIEAATARLTEAGVCFGHGTTNARDEAAWLILWSLGLPLDAELEGPQSQELRPISAAESQKCATLIEARIASRKPAAYLTREAWLQGVSFYVDERVIVPRSLIAELLVEGSLDYWLREDTHALLDLCTGNGSLAVIAALVYPDTRVDAADISTDALAVAAINVERHHLRERVQLIESDGLRALPHTYDLILCNPPYVNAESMSALPPEFQAEPALALDGNRLGGADGMDFVRSLLKEVPRVMNPGAVLVLEIGHERAFFEAAFPALAAIWLETSAGEDQVLLLTREALSA